MTADVIQGVHTATSPLNVIVQSTEPKRACDNRSLHMDRKRVRQAVYHSKQPTRLSIVHSTGTTRAIDSRDDSCKRFPSVCTAWKREFYVDEDNHGSQHRHTQSLYARNLWEQLCFDRDDDKRWSCK